MRFCGVKVLSFLGKKTLYYNRGKTLFFSAPLKNLGFSTKTLGQFSRDLLSQSWAHSRAGGRPLLFHVHL